MVVRAGFMGVRHGIGQSARHSSGESAEWFELNAICMARCLQVFEEEYWRIGQHIRFNLES